MAQSQNSRQGKSFLLTTERLITVQYVLYSTVPAFHSLAKDESSQVPHTCSATGHCLKLFIACKCSCNHVKV